MPVDLDISYVEARGGSCEIEGAAGERLQQAAKKVHKKLTEACRTC